jgi:hypothetical protein
MQWVPILSLRRHNGAKMNGIIFTAIIFFGFVFNASASADGLDDMRSSIAAFEKGRLCPSTGRADILEAPKYCHAIWDRPCNSTSNACYDEVARCRADVDRINEVITKYNSIVDHCLSERKESAAAPSASPRKSSNGVLSLNDVREAQSKADEIRKKVRDELNEASQKAKALETERQSLKEAATTLSHGCQYAVTQCEQRVEALSGLQPETRSQCRASCQLMQIESCNPSSPTVQQASNICTDGAVRDTEAAASNARAERAAKVAEQRESECIASHTRRLARCSNGDPRNASFCTRTAQANRDLCSAIARNASPQEVEQLLHIVKIWDDGMFENQTNLNNNDALVNNQGTDYVPSSQPSPGYSNSARQSPAQPAPQPPRIAPAAPVSPPCVKTSAFMTCVVK